MGTRFIRFRLFPAAGVAIALALSVAAPAFAHEVRPVGAYIFTVGWLHEPAYTDEENAVQFLLKDSKGTPVSNLGDTLKVEVTYQGQKMPATILNPTFDPDTGLGMPGEYIATLIPTRPGNYTFHFLGTVNGQTIDQSFTSSPSTFNPVQDPTTIEFPAQDPTRSQIGQLLSRISPRIAAVQAADQSDIGTVRTLSVVAIGLGTLALIGVVFALVRRSGNGRR